MPQSEVAWLAQHGVLRHYDTGSILTHKEKQVEGLHIVMSGHLSIHVDHGAGRRKLMEWRAGDVTGLMPYSRLVAPPADVLAEEPSEVLTIFRDQMPEMIRECHELTAVLVHVMLDRARHFTSSYLHDEKLVSLGKLAAGLAHELNNPASAIGRSAGEFHVALRRFDEASRSLGTSCLEPPQLAALEKLRASSLAAGAQPVLSPLEQEDREDSLTRWLRKHGAKEALADGLAETDVTTGMLDELALTMQGPVLDAALRWVAADCATRRLASEIQQAAIRITDLVRAVKGFTQMDRAAVPEPVDLETGLANTLAVLGSKAKTKSVSVSLNLERNLPPIQGFGGELNQVWSNLLDNALDAVDHGGEIEIAAARCRDGVMVRIIDNGSGVPDGIRDRIFDPFFTTKPVGKGSGLGLDIVRRLVQRHNGQIELESKPGRTEFRVTLPGSHA